MRFCTVLRGGYISTHAPAGGATCTGVSGHEYQDRFLLTPLREGRRGDTIDQGIIAQFLLTPLREGRLKSRMLSLPSASNFYSRPCGRGDVKRFDNPHTYYVEFLLTPLREGRQQFSTSPS